MAQDKRFKIYYVDSGSRVFINLIKLFHATTGKKFGVRNVKGIISRAAQNGLVKFPKEQDLLISVNGLLKNN